MKLFKALAASAVIIAGPAFAEEQLSIATGGTPAPGSVTAPPFDLS